METEQIIGTIVVLVVMIGLFVICFLANRKIPKPKGCEDLEAECENCPITTCLKNTSEKEK